MSHLIEIHTEKYKFRAKLNSSLSSEKLTGILPVKSVVNRWGDEIYFSIPLEVEIENGKESMEIGDIAFWPPGNAFCIFFGKTPASTDDKPRAASPVTVLGKLTDIEPDILRKVRSGETIEIRKTE